MIPDYHFRSDHAPATNTRWLSPLLYGAAVLLLLAAIYEFYLYFTHWAVGDEAGHTWQLVLGILYLVVSALLVYFAALRRRRGAEAPPERYVHIRRGVLTYQLDQLNGEQRVDLNALVAAQRPSVRDMILELADGRRVVLPVYLIDDEDKQKELEGVLQAAAAGGGAS